MPAADGVSVSVLPLTAALSPVDGLTAAVYVTVAPKKFEPSVTVFAAAVGLSNVTVLSETVISNPSSP